MKRSARESNPLATIGAIVTLTIIGLSAKHCMKKYALKPSKRMKL
ncbi:MAG: hypothetical protein ACI4GA_00330 [Acutalibacteraceae bacterium]|nr:hypothetical protein [Oscillospiraceae bacterium]